MANLTNAQLRKTWLDDSYEKAGETAKTAVEHLNYAFNPFAESPFDKKSEKSEQPGVHEAKDQNNSPLDFDRLQKKYGEKDKLEYEALHTRFFKKIKTEEEQLLEEKKQRKAQQEKQAEEEEAEEKQRQEQEKQSQVAMPTSVQKGPNAGGGRKKANPMEDLQADQR